MLVQFIYLSVCVCRLFPLCGYDPSSLSRLVTVKVSLFPTHLLLHTSVSVEISLCVCEMCDFLVHQV